MHKVNINILSLCTCINMKSTWSCNHQCLISAKSCITNCGGGVQQLSSGHTAALWISHKLQYDTRK